MSTPPGDSLIIPDLTGITEDPEGEPPDAEPGPDGTVIPPDLQGDACPGDDQVSDLVPTEEIERAVGHDRHPAQHLARAVSEQQTVYLLHSKRCKDKDEDLRACQYSIALDRGIDPDDWSGLEDRQNAPGATWNTVRPRDLHMITTLSRSSNTPRTRYRSRMCRSNSSRLTTSS